MNWDATDIEEYGDELTEESRNRELDYQRSRPNRSLRSNSKQRQGSARRVDCGIAARRNRRWNW